MKKHKADLKKSKPTTQSEAIIQEIKKIHGDNFIVGKTEAKNLLTPKEINKIADSIAEKIERKEVYYSKAIPDRPILFRYIKTVIFNLLSKSKKLNGGVAYEPASGKGKNLGRKKNERDCRNGTGSYSRPDSEKESGYPAKKLKERPVEAFSTVIFQDEADLILKRFKE